MEKVTQWKPSRISKFRVDLNIKFPNIIRFLKEHGIYEEFKRNFNTKSKIMRMQDELNRDQYFLWTQDSAPYMWWNDDNDTKRQKYAIAYLNGLVLFYPRNRDMHSHYYQGVNDFYKPERSNRQPRYRDYSHFSGMHPSCSLTFFNPKDF